MTAPRQVRVAGLDTPACGWTDDDGRYCIFWDGHPAVKAPSGPHAPDRPVAAPKPAAAVDPMAMRA